MQWKWNEVRQNGNQEAVKSRALSGGTRFNIFIVLCLLAIIGWAVAVISGPYLRRSRLQNRMAEWMRDYRNMTYDEMIERLIKDAQTIGIKDQIGPENFSFEGDVGKESTLRCNYVETIKLPRGRYYVLNMEAKKTIKIPAE